MELNINLSNELKEKIEKLTDWLIEKNKVLIMLSGGLDSGLLTYVASRVIPKGTYAITIKSLLVSNQNIRDAADIAKLSNINHKIVKIDILNVPELNQNPKNRCYLCKKNIINKIKQYAKNLSIAYILDGTNFDDLKIFRPGRKALEEEAILSPLALFNFTKNDIRKTAQSFDLFFKDNPSDSCLLTRFPYNKKITIEDIQRVDEAEKIIREELKSKQIRVRDYKDYCRIEIDKNEFKLLTNPTIIDKITKKLKKLGYKYITLDLEGFRSGSMDL